ncbi:uncharacterized protein N7484_008561 [Penicillium longicatenatum]|uniref:uncharacterized protein n=1 Tax=Penicillium longicatenatum TaxID=1561947 RepID=UPI002546FD6B|nr:uncharacterized protein N7484_008561 [Penicillium longicatenatum]KAJ5635248.1 hypothetical protein N7484_008561 [Penicillium longicatenatum]
MEFHNSGGFPKRRSYPNLHHISLAPLTPRFPIDDDIEPTDYFHQDGEDSHSGTGVRNTTRSSSYLSSVSVPSTPPILSHSRSSSRTRHHTRSKSSTRATPLSDTNLHSKSISFPLHHNLGPQRKRPSTQDHNNHPTTKSDAEWMLRAGIAIASTTREEKGQSWLSKRESSTSLVSETPFDDPALPPHHRHHHRTRSGASSRKSRSGASTPAAYSRRSSRSRGNSRHGSRAGLTMTTIPPLSSVSGKIHSPTTTGAVTPETRGRSTEAGLVPDFVDERIRAEMESLQQENRDQDQDRRLNSLDDVLGEEWDREEDLESVDEFSDEFSDDNDEEFDEADLQRLTRERGFGLGSWIDRLVEWTLFGVDELPVVPVSSARIGGAATTTTVTFEEPAGSSHADPAENHDTLSSASGEDRSSLSDDVDASSHTDGESIIEVEKPGAHGGWEDAGWLFRVMKRALV